MRSIIRLPEPQILINKKVIWLSNLISSGKNRPDSNKYANENIKIQLNSMSFNKCFYCETKLKGKRIEVDHHIEVSVDITKSFEWTNLYLACDSCNNKIPHSVIPIYDTLNPCIDNDTKILEHLTFKDELIEPLNNSILGLKTIQKYRLDSEVLDTRRLKSLKLFLTLICEIRKIQIIEKRDYLSSDELNAINRFKNVDHSYSLMFTILINKFGY